MEYLISVNRALVSKDPLKAGTWNGPFYLLEARAGSGKVQRNVFFCLFFFLGGCNLLLAHCSDVLLLLLNLIY